MPLSGVSGAAYLPGWGAARESLVSRAASALLVSRACEVAGEESRWAGLAQGAAQGRMHAPLHAQRRMRAGQRAPGRARQSRGEQRHGRQSTLNRAQRRVAAAALQRTGRACSQSTWP